MSDVIHIRRDPTPAADPAPMLADARMLGPILCAGVRTIRTWDSAGRLPEPLRIGGRVLWRLDEIRAWLAAGAPDRDAWAAMRDAH